MISAADFAAIFSTSNRNNQLAFRDRRKPQTASADCLSRWEDDGGPPQAVLTNQRTKTTLTNNGEGGVILPR